MPSELLAGVHPASADARFYAPLPERSAAAGEVVGLVPACSSPGRLRGLPGSPRERLIGFMASTASSRTFASSRRRVGGGEHCGERDAPSVRHNVALRARFATMRRIRPGFSAPFLRARSPNPAKPSPTRSGRPPRGGPGAPDATLSTTRSPPARHASAASTSSPSRSPSASGASPRVWRSLLFRRKTMPPRRPGRAPWYERPWAWAAPPLRRGFDTTMDKEGGCAREEASKRDETRR